VKIKDLLGLDPELEIFIKGKPMPDGKDKETILYSFQDRIIFEIRNEAGDVVQSPCIFLTNAEK